MNKTQQSNKIINKNKEDNYFKSYTLVHKANPGKVDILFQLYSVYKNEYKSHIYNYWNLFLHNKIRNNKFSHIGSTKHITTQLNSAYLQICLSQACASLNNHIDSISKKFNHIVNNSSINNKELLHKLRTINLKHAWCNNTITYFPIITKDIVDDFGNLIIIKEKQETIIDKNTIKLSRKIFNYIIDKNRVTFPNINKPKILLDSRVYELEQSRTNSFDCWLKVSTLNKGKKISIPIQYNDYFNLAKGKLGKTIEMNFNNYDYNITTHKYNSLTKPKKNKVKNKGLAKVNRTVDFIFNRQPTLTELFSNFEYKNLTKNKIVAIDLGLCNFLATSTGELYGAYWLDKLTVYDKKITDLAASRQSLGFKTSSKKYDGLVNQVRGFIKTEINRILNHYFNVNQDIKTIVIENLKFSSPGLSRKLNRIIQNFGLKLFKEKLAELSLFYGFEIVELNPAYTSQECNVCGYVDENNRKSQDKFECKCCGSKIHADINGARTNLKRFEVAHRSKNNKDGKNIITNSIYKSVILGNIKNNFVAKIKHYVSNGLIGRRRLYNLLENNKYFKQDLKVIVNTTKASGVKPISIYNFEEYLLKYYTLNATHHYR